MDPQYGERYRELYERHWWWRARTEFIVETLRRLQPGKRRERILDVGCGDGLFFPRLREFGEVEGIEPCSDLVRATNPDRDHIHVCPFDDTFQPGTDYSLILMLDVLEHVKDPLSFLRRVRELLTSDGTVLITVPAFMMLWTNHDAINHHFTRYTRTGLSKVSSDAGLRIVDARYFYHWTAPVKLGLRALESTLRLQPKPPQVPPAWINKPCYLISRFEQRTLGRLPMPVGSSLMAVATHE